MLGKTGFDLWAEGYDSAVELSDRDGTYPFAGYKEVLASIFRESAVPGLAVLDVGFGTGVLTKALYEKGCRIYGQDFSEKMVALAARKMPDAHLYRGDLTEGLVEPLRQGRYDRIVATYSLHHLLPEQQAVLLSQLLDRLNDGGKLLIGDVAFETRSDLEKCRLGAGDEWDDEEVYFVAAEMREKYPQLRFTWISFCAGVLEIEK